MERSITDLDKGDKINIPQKDTMEPIFQHTRGGRREAVNTGNTDFVTGDRIARPPESDGSGGGQASNSGEGEDEFVFQLSREEFLEFFFEDLELPDLIKTQLRTVVDYKMVRAGFTNSGVPANINVVRSLRGAMARRIALRGPHMAKLRDLEDQLEKLESGSVVDSPTYTEMSLANKKREIKRLKKEITVLKKKIKAIPFIDTFDLRYNHRVKEPKPTTQAVMFCIMDVSGSMNELRKDLAKRFFILLHLFLTRTYENIEVVFIRHHTTAKEVDEEEFFYSRETGGTVVSSALEMMHNIILERYPTNDWNIYAAQASDGDNWDGDSPSCSKLLLDKILSLVQFYAYVEITTNTHQSLWREYEKVSQLRKNFAMQAITGPKGIYPVFRQLFAKKIA